MNNIEPKPTTAEILFNRLFTCQIKKLHTLSKIQLEEFGLFSSGDRAFDEQSLQEFIYQRITIVQMVEYFNRGVDILVTDPRDCVDIYETIKAHLEAHLHHVKFSLNQSTTPVEELKQMDTFAAAIFPIACRYKPAEELKISVGLQSLISSGPQVFDKSLKKFQNGEEEPQRNVKQHVPIADEIAKYARPGQRGLF